MTNQYRGLQGYTPLTDGQIERGEFFEYKGNKYWDDPHTIHSIPDGGELMMVVKGVEVYIPTDIYKPAFIEATGLSTVKELWMWLKRHGLKRDLLAFFNYSHDYYHGIHTTRYSMTTMTTYQTWYNKQELLDNCEYWMRGVNDDLRLDSGYDNPIPDYSPSTSAGTRGNSSSTKSLFSKPEPVTPRVDPEALAVPTCFGREQYRRQYKQFYLNVERQQRTGRIIQWDTKLNYTYRMSDDEHTFFRKTKRCASATYLGLELEIATAVDYSELQEVVQCEEPKQEPFFIMKDDGSVGGKYANKVELVTVPMSPRKLKQEFKKFTDKVYSLAGGKVDDFIDTDRTLNNGIHIHVSKKAFDSSYHQRKFQMLFNSWDIHDRAFLQDMTQRGQDYFSYQYSSVPDSYKERKVSTKVNNRTFQGAARHSSCHSGNSETIEVRIFQGIFEYQHIAKCIDLVHSMVEYSNEVPLSVAGKSWNNHFKAWLFKQNGYLNLKKELKG